jgi:hypothetical protein
MIVSEDLIWQQLAEQRNNNSNEKKKTKQDDDHDDMDMFTLDLIEMYKKQLIPCNAILDASCQHECTDKCPRRWHKLHHSICTISGNDHLCTPQDCLYRVRSSSQRFPTCWLTGRVCEDDTNFVPVTWADRQGESDCMQIERKSSSSSSGGKYGLSKQEERASALNTAVETMCANALRISDRTGHSKHVNAIKAIVQKFYTAFYEAKQNDTNGHWDSVFSSLPALTGMIIHFLSEGRSIRVDAKTELVLVPQSKFVASAASWTFNRLPNFPPGVRLSKIICAAVPRLKLDTLKKLSAEIDTIRQASEDCLDWVAVQKGNG